jgi:hypothetical protein
VASSSEFWQARARSAVRAETRPRQEHPFCYLFSLPLHVFVGSASFPFDFLFDFSVRSLSSTGYLVSRTRENIVPSVHWSLRAGAMAKILV